MGRSRIELLQQELGDRALPALRAKIETMSDERKIFDTIVTGDSYGFMINIMIGVIDRGPRMDSDHLSENDIADISKKMFQKYDITIDRVKRIIQNELGEFNLKGLSVSPDYGEKGHVCINAHFRLEGLFATDKRGNKMWIDISGRYHNDQVIVMTPDIERYFDTIEQAKNFVKNYSPEEVGSASNLPF